MGLQNRAASDRRSKDVTGAMSEPSIWQAPLVYVALAMTAGIIADRYCGIPLFVSLVTVVACLIAWIAARVGHTQRLALIYLALAGVAFGAAYHHWRRDVYAGDDIGNYASADPEPVHLRGVIAEEPTYHWRLAHDPLQSIPVKAPTHSIAEERAEQENDDYWGQIQPPASTISVLEVTHWQQPNGDWIAISGRARLVVEGQLKNMHAGDSVEVVGRIAAPQRPQNPGESDYAATLPDQPVRAVVVVRKTADGVTLVQRGWTYSLTGILGAIRGWGQRVLLRELPAEQGPVATALLLGEGSAMTHHDWDKYKRTGAIHALAISGWHLAVLGTFLWWLSRLLGVRRRYAALFVALFLLAYSLLTGGRPPAMRAAVTVCAAAGAVLLGRRTMLANSFALAWIVVLLLNPSDFGDTGCQLSFIAVALLYWGIGPWFEPTSVPLHHLVAETRPAWLLYWDISPWFVPTTDPLQQLVEETRPAWERLLRKIARSIVHAFATTWIIWLSAAPLVAARYHTVPFVGLIVGPPAMLLASIALITGFLLLLSALICWPLVPVFAWMTKWCLIGCEYLVDAGDRLPGGHWYVGDVPEWWLWVFYAGLFAALTIEWLRRRWQWTALAGLAWLCIGLLSGLGGPARGEFRCTFLAVGNGGCTVMEMPDGRTILYDAGSMTGPDVAVRQIAPYLWNRGIRRIDEIFLSHADLDHFNGVVALSERFAIKQITCTPSFSEKPTEGVQFTLETLKQRGIPVRIVHDGYLGSAGGVEIEVLHPLSSGPEGKPENPRSMVLLITHAGHTLLLTGDLEGPGLQRLCGLPPRHVDILMAPHHGGRKANTPELAEWAQPKVVVSCQGRPRYPVRPPNPYTMRDKETRYLGTWPHGAITIRSQQDVLQVETFVTRQVVFVNKGP